MSRSGYINISTIDSTAVEREQYCYSSALNCTGQQLERGLYNKSYPRSQFLQQTASEKNMAYII